MLRLFPLTLGLLFSFGLSPAYTNPASTVTVTNQSNCLCKLGESGVKDCKNQYSIQPIYIVELQKDPNNNVIFTEKSKLSINAKNSFQTYKTNIDPEYKDTSVMSYSKCSQNQYRGGKCSPPYYDIQTQRPGFDTFTLVSVNGPFGESDFWPVISKIQSIDANCNLTNHLSGKL